MSRPQIVVTGASRGIGAAIAAELDRRGFAVAGLSRSGEAPVGYGLICDVGNLASVEAAIETVKAKGPIVGLVNAAGAHASKRSTELEVDEFEAMMHLNATSVLAVSQKTYPHLAETGDALIVNIGSFLDKMAVPENVAYCASKAAVGAITRCLAAEWARDGIRVMNVAPGYIETDLNRDFLARDKIKAWLDKRVPVGRVGQPPEVAQLVGALFSENIGFLSGETIYLDGVQGAYL
ncbi:SDR family NAD(P)-dependent oxidoreductase [Mesorhizobium amorphae]|uniref:SDR family NAD(P)-dependent oxidoreductase n=1 Tax=Mesorhizobium amorphae TaxID=71433 RepID=UPI001781DD06|nr:SDR family oxidoreductase [Mesorhizobium amorphae]